MTQLLSAGFARLFKNKLFWFGNILFTGFFIFVSLMNYRNMSRYPDLYHYTGSTFMFAPFQIIGIFASCFTGMFLGTEYRDGTLRNKLVIGRSRTQVYLSNLVVSFSASLFTSIVSILITFLSGIALFGEPELTSAKMLMTFGLGILMLVSFSGIFTLISMLVPSKSAGSVINIIFFLALVIAGLNVTNMLQQPEFITPGYTLTLDGVLQPLEAVPNPHYLQGMKRSVFEFFRDLFPTSQGSLLMAQMTSRPLVMALCSLGITVCTTISGVFHFCRKDLK